jgi:hypothetical protein
MNAALPVLGHCTLGPTGTVVVVVGAVVVGKVVVVVVEVVVVVVEVVVVEVVDVGMVDVVDVVELLVVDELVVEERGEVAVAGVEEKRSPPTRAPQAPRPVAKRENCFQRVGFTASIYSWTSRR